MRLFRIDIPVDHLPGQQARGLSAFSVLHHFIIRRDLYEAERAIPIFRLSAGERERSLRLISETLLLTTANAIYVHPFVLRTDLRRSRHIPARVAVSLLSAVAKCRLSRKHNLLYQILSIFYFLFRHFTTLTPRLHFPIETTQVQTYPSHSPSRHARSRITEFGSHQVHFSCNSRSIGPSEWGSKHQYQRPTDRETPWRREQHIQTSPRSRP